MKENLGKALLKTKFEIDSVEIYAEDSLRTMVSHFSPWWYEGLEKIIIDSSLEMVDFDGKHYLAVHPINTEDLFVCSDTDEIMTKSDLEYWYELDKEEFEYKSLDDAIDAWTDMGGNLYRIWEA